MPHVIEPAASGRAKCRGCGEPIAKGALRLGERLPNPFGEGEMTLWFHPGCGAYKRPEPFLEALEAPESRAAIDAAAANAGAAGSVDTRAEPATVLTPEVVDHFRAEAELGAAHRRLPRLDGASRSPTGRARCRSCRESIAKDEWRIGLVYYEEGYFNPSGFIHAGCSRAYFEAEDVEVEALIQRIGHFSPDLSAGDLSEIRAELGAT